MLPKSQASSDYTYELVEEDEEEDVDIDLTTNKDSQPSARSGNQTGTSATKPADGDKSNLKSGTSSEGFAEAINQKDKPEITAIGNNTAPSRMSSSSIPIHLEESNDAMEYSDDSEIIHRPETPAMIGAGFGGKSKTPSSTSLAVSVGQAKEGESSK